MKRAPLKRVGHKTEAALEIYAKIKLLLHGFLCHCARCGLRTSIMDWHHPYKRGRAKFFWKLFCIVPMCRSCHDEIHSNENQARKDGWLIKPVHKDPYKH